MTVFITRDKADQVIELRVRAEGSATIGDAVIEVRPGQTVFGRTFDEWMTHPGPSVTIED